MTEEHLKQWEKIREPILKDRQKKFISRLHVEFIAKLHAEVFKHKFISPCKSCGKKWFVFLDDLEASYQNSIKSAKKPMSEETKRKISESMKKRKSASTKKKKESQ